MYIKKLTLAAFFMCISFPLLAGYEGVDGSGETHPIPFWGVVALIIYMFWRLIKKSPNNDRSQVTPPNRGQDAIKAFSMPSEGNNNDLKKWEPTPTTTFDTTEIVSDFVKMILCGMYEHYPMDTPEHHYKSEIRALPMKNRRKLFSAIFGLINFPYKIFGVDRKTINDLLSISPNNDIECSYDSMSNSFTLSRTPQHDHDIKSVAIYYLSNKMCLDSDIIDWFIEELELGLFKDINMPIVSKTQQIAIAFTLDCDNPDAMHDHIIDLLKLSDDILR